MKLNFYLVQIDTNIKLLYRRKRAAVICSKTKIQPILTKKKVVFNRNVHLNEEGEI